MAIGDISTLEMIRAKQATFRLTFRDEDGVLIDLTGKTIHWTAKWAYEDADAAAVFARATGGSGITILTQSGATLGQCDVSLIAALSDVAAIPHAPVALVWDAILLDGGLPYAGGGLRGELVILPAVRRATA